MADSLPIQIQLGALPAAVRWTPQQLGDALVARMRLVTAQTFALFVAGSTEPSSNSGPWLKNDSEWWVWSDTAGAYVPITITPESLGYTIGSVAPDPNVYSFWIETTAGGSPLALKIYYAGAWTDVYASVIESAGLIPPNTQSSDYTLVLADKGKNILHPSADASARTFTIPANSSVAFPVGAAITFTNQNAAGVITIAITTDTMRLAGPGTTGSRTLAANGIATALKLTTTEWIISGTGLS